MNAQYMAVDQYGETFWNLRHPRKDLLNALGRSHAERMYIDAPKGAKHIGYIIAGRWLRVYGLEGTTFAREAWS